MECLGLAKPIASSKKSLNQQDAYLVQLKIGNPLVIAGYDSRSSYSTFSSANNTARACRRLFPHSRTSASKPCPAIPLTTWTYGTPFLGFPRKGHPRVFHGVQFPFRGPCVRPARPCQVCYRSLHSCTLLPEGFYRLEVELCKPRDLENASGIIATPSLSSTRFRQSPATAESLSSSDSLDIICAEML